MGQAPQLRSGGGVVIYGVYPAPGHYGSGSLVSPISTHDRAAEALAAAERETRRFLARLRRVSGGGVTTAYRVVADTRRVRGAVLDRLPSVQP